MLQSQFYVICLNSTQTCDVIAAKCNEQHTDETGEATKETVKKKERN